MFAQGRTSLSYKDVLDVVSEESILEYFSGITTIPCVMNSPLRKDNHPSFSVFYSDSGRIHFKDFGNKSSFNLVGFLKELLHKNEASDVIDEIVNNLDSIKLIDKFIVKSERPKNQRTKGRSKTTKELKVKIRAWKDYDLDFWLQFGINKYWLEFGNIYPISHIFLGEDCFTSDKYAYCYVEFKDNNPTLKIYQPYSETWKWLNNHDSSVWDLWTQALNSESKDLIITSSRKDALCLWANTGIPSVSLQSETTFPKPHVVQQLKDEFKTIWCLYDNDYDKEKNYGRDFSIQLSELYNFKRIEIPEFFQSKDPSDLYYNHGSKIFKQVLNQLLKK